MVKRRAITLFAVLSVVVVVLTLAGPLAFSNGPRAPHERQLIVADGRGSEVFFQAPAAQINHIELEWIHSVEKEPWREVYRVSDRQFLLTDVYLKGYGAGVPSNLEGSTVNEKGQVHTSNIDREIEELNWVHSHATNHTFRIFLTHQSEPVVLRHDIPHHTFATAFITKTSDMGT